MLVRDTDEALRFYSGRLGLAVAASEEISSPHVRLTYLDAGNAYIQLVEPLTGNTQLTDWLDEHGEGLHHICFGVDDVAGAVGERDALDGCLAKLPGRSREMIALRYQEGLESAEIGRRA